MHILHSIPLQQTRCQIAFVCRSVSERKLDGLFPRYEMYVMWNNLPQSAMGRYWLDQTAADMYVRSLSIHDVCFRRGRIDR